MASAVFISPLASASSNKGIASVKLPFSASSDPA